MKYSKNSVLLIILVILFISSFAFPGAISTEIGEIVSRVYTKDEGIASTTHTTSTVSSAPPLVVEESKEQSVTQESVLRDREIRLAALVRKDLSGSYVTKDQFGIIEDGPESHLTVDVSQLLPKNKWGIFSLNKNDLAFRYPTKGWFLQKGTTRSLFILSNTKSGLPEGNLPWAKITVGEYERKDDMPILDWMKQNAAMKNGVIPPSDLTTQYVTIGGSVFLGSIFFKDNIWFGKKSVYAEISPTYVFAGTLEVKNMMATSSDLGKFDQIFYTMMETLEIRQTSNQ